MPSLAFGISVASLAAMEICPWPQPRACLRPAVISPNLHSSPSYYGYLSGFAQLQCPAAILLMAAWLFDPAG